jgi:hypothetical protein
MHSRARGLAWLGVAALLVSAGACGGRSDLEFGAPQGSAGLGGSATGGFGGDAVATGGNGGFAGDMSLGGEAGSCPDPNCGVGGTSGSGGDIGSGGDLGFGGVGGETGGFGGVGGTGGFAGTSAFGGAAGVGGTGIGGSGGSATTGGVGGVGGTGIGGTGGIAGSGGSSIGGTGGTTGTGGSGTGGTGGVVQCVECITQSCPQVQQCLGDTSCRQGVECVLTQCLSGGGFNFQCAIGCFNGDFGAAIQALQAVQCVYQQCGANCVGGIGGGTGGATGAGGTVGVGGTFGFGGTGFGGSAPIDAGIGGAPPTPGG